MIKEKSVTIKVYSIKTYNLNPKIYKNGDNCGKESIKSYKDYNYIIKKKNYYYCKKCSVNIDNKKTCLEKYGVDNVMKNDIIKQKMYDTNFKKYDYMCSVQSPNIKRQH